MPRKKDPEVEAAKKALSASTPRVPPVSAVEYLSTGLTVLNLAMSGRTTGGVAKGTYVYFVGDSSSGKTWFGMQLMAEACRNPEFADYRMIFDNAENGSFMDVARFFGQKLLGRVEPPAREKDGSPKYSETIQEFYYHVDAALDGGPCIYVLDSMDALNDDVSEENFEEERKVFETGKGDPGGSMGMEKAKYNSNHINRVVRRLARTRSILFVVSQTRDKTNGRFPGQKTRAGGRALKFYSHVEVWTSVKGEIARTYKNKDRHQGSWLHLDVQKNRFSGHEGKVTVPFYRTHGVDEVGASVDFLVEEGHWKKVKAEKGSKDRIDAPEFGIEGTREQVIKHIETENGERELQLLVGEVWRAIEEAIKVERKPRYE